MERFFTDPIVLTLFFLGVIFVLAGISRLLIAPIRRYAIPSSIIAGVLGLTLCSWISQILKVDPAEIKNVLKMIVYHGLALVYIAICLQRPPKSASTPDAVSMGFGIGSMAALQGLIGMGGVLVLGLAAGELLHPGFGLLLPLGYNQGPGQAFTFGTAWESSGLANGGDIGLIIAALGFAWSIFVGIPLVTYGRKQGWITSFEEEVETLEEGGEEHSDLGMSDPLTRHLTAIAVVYLVVYLILMLLTGALAGKEKIVDMLWGLHFILAMMVALGTRKILHRLPLPQLDNRVLGRVSNLLVDVVTCSALAAIQISVLKDNWLPIVLISLVGGVVTVFGVLWLASRAFLQAPFHHAVLWFGASTGTLPMGLALLRMIDPELRSPAPTSIAVGSVFAVLFSAPLLAILPYPVSQWPDGHPFASWVTIGLLIVYFVSILLAWRFIGKLRFVGRGLWKQEAKD